MGKLQKLQCEQCGGKIDGITLACQSCGMQYRLNEDMSLVRVEVYNRRFQVLEGKVSTPLYVLHDMGEQQYSEMTLTTFAEKMAKSILPFMEFRTQLEHDGQTLTTIGSVRIAEPRTAEVYNGGKVYRMP